MSKTDDDLPEQQGQEREFIIRGHLDPASVPRADLWQYGLEDLSNLEVIGDFFWSPIGPAPLTVDRDQRSQGLGPNAGEVTDIAIDPSGSTDQIIYIATNDGGIWKTTNADDPGGNPAWTQKTDFMRSLSMGAVALDPSNPKIVYAGTGNLFDGGDAFTKGVGIYKSIDGGETWAHIDGGIFATIFANIGINRIVLPASDILLVATNKGLFRSVDGGMNFGNKAPSFNNGLALAIGAVAIQTGNISSLRLDTATPTTVYAAVSGVGIFKSTDSGATFPTMLLPTKPVPPNLPVPSGPFDDIAFAQSSQINGQVNVQTMYASVQQGKQPPSFKDLYKSTDGGLNWTALTNAHGAANDASKSGHDQTNYDLTVGVDPQDANVVYIGFQELYRSDDGGANFPTPAYTHGQVHFDHHALVFSPATHWGVTPLLLTRVYVGTDGGIAKREPVGTTWLNQNGAIAANLFRGIDIGLGAKNGYTYGGMQDTGTAGHRPADAPDPADSHLEEWHAGINGDGGVVAVDPVNPKIVYGFENEFFIKTLSRGKGWVPSTKVVFQITGASNTSPIVITAAGHPFRTGLFVVISGVTGNLAANGTWKVTVPPTAPNTFSLDGSDGTSAGLYVPKSGTVKGPAFKIDAATNTKPIKIEMLTGGLVEDGDTIEVIGVAGNTAANGIWTVKKTDQITYELNDPAGNDSQGNGTYTTDGVAMVALIGQGLGNERGDRTRCVALPPNGVNPATVVYVSEAAKLYKSVDAGVNFALAKDFSNNLPNNLFKQDVTAIACPDANKVWVGLADATVHFSGDGGATWDAASFKTLPGGTGSVEGIAVDPNDLSLVAIVYSGMSEINPLFKTHHCYLTIDAWKNWTDISGTDGGGPVGNLPDLPLHSVVWDTSTTPPTLIVASDAGVLRCADPLNPLVSWQVLGVDLPAVSCQSLAIDLDTTVSPNVRRVLRVGTYGRSCFELSKPAGPRLIIKSNLAFGAVLPGHSADLPLTLFNVGNADLKITDFSPAIGSDKFLVTPAIVLPLTIGPSSKAELNVRFQPSTEGNQTASFQLQSDDPNALSASIYASGWGATTPATPRMGVGANLNFGVVQGGESRTLPIRILNTGLADLTIKKISRTSGSSSDFKIVEAPHFPAIISPGGETSLKVRFKPRRDGNLTADFQIESDDPHVTPLIKAKGKRTSTAAKVSAAICVLLGVAVLGALTLYEIIHEPK